VDAEPALLGDRHIDPAFPVDWSVLRERVVRRESFRNFKLKLRNGDEIAYYELAPASVRAW